MATTREVKVIINGEEYVSGAAQKAETGLAAFTGKIPGWAAAAGALVVAWKAISAAVEAVGDFVMDSIGAYDDFAAAQAKLAAQSKLTGIPLSELRETVRKAREEFGLGSIAAVDITAAVAKFATGAGASAKSTDLMRSALELGAAAGMDAKQVAEGLSSAFAGNDEWLNRLGLANPSQLWKDYAAANGRAVSTLTDTEQKLAVMTAIMDAGNTVAGVYAERMASGAGAQERLNNRLDDAKIAFGAAIQPIRIVVIQGLGALLEMLSPLIVGIGQLANIVGLTLAYKFQEARGAIGGVVEVVGKLIGNKGLQEWGRETEEASDKAKLSLLNMASAIKDGGKESEAAAPKHRAASATIVQSAADQEKAFKQSYDIQKTMYKVLEESTVSYKKVIDTLKPSIEKSFEPGKIDAFNTTMKAAKETADTLMDGLRDEMSAMPLVVEQVNEKIGGTGQKLEGAARATLDFAQAFGVVDDEAASALNSIINIGASIGRMYSGDVVGGATGLIGGIANLISALNNTENKNIVRALNFELNKLRQEIGNLDLNVSGEDFNNTKRFIENFWAASEENFKKTGGGLLTSGPEFLRMLSESGMTLGDLERVANEMGLKLLGESGNVNGETLRILLQRLNASEFGTVGQGFDSQLEFFRTRQRLEGSAGTVGGMQGLFDFLRNAGGVSALNGIDLSDPNARNQLLDLFTRLNNGGVGPGEVGRLTGSQFADLLEEIIQSLGAGGGTGPDVGAGGGIGGGDTGTGGTVGTPTLSTGEMVSAAITAQTDALQLTLESANAFHTRIADATESAAATLLRIEDLLVSANWVESVDRQLARTESFNDFAAGRGLSF